MFNYNEVRYGKVEKPELFPAQRPVDLTDNTMKEHREKILAGMKQEKLDFLFIYADREHGGNFGYLTGFEPRFEEAVLVLHQDGKAFLLLGNESVKMGNYSRIQAEVIPFPYFSLPNQPMEAEDYLENLIKRAGIQSGMHGGMVGWKLFTSKFEDNHALYDIPYFLVKTVTDIIGKKENIRNAAGLFIDSEKGARARVNENEIAHYEYGASRASECIYHLMEELEPGKTELELARHLAADGQPLATQAICATGDRFTNAVVAPRDKKVSRGHRFAMSMGLRGGLTCRTGYAADREEELPEQERNYMDRVVKPYYAALNLWYSTIAVGMEAGKLYDLIEKTIPKEVYGWQLNPGHLTSSEEWMSSPFYKGSKVILKSGMMFQMDIILSVPGYSGSNAEDGIVLADQPLQEQIRKNYPDMWNRMQKRREYLIHTLGIQLGEEVLPMSNLNGYLRPFLLAKDKAMYIQKD